MDKKSVAPGPDVSMTGPPPPNYSHGYAPQPAGGMSSQQQTNVVVVNQPQDQNMLRVIHNLPGHRGWTSGLFGCTEDMSSCLYTWWCYSCAICSLSQRLGEGFCMPCCNPAAEFNIRTRIRSIGGIQGSMSNDCCVLSYCAPCAACQEARELTAMGL